MKRLDCRQVYVSTVIEAVILLKAPGGGIRVIEIHFSSSSFTVSQVKDQWFQIHENYVFCIHLVYQERSTERGNIRVGVSSRKGNALSATQVFSREADMKTLYKLYKRSYFYGKNASQ